MSRIDRPRAVFLSQFFPPETFAGANRAHALARALTATHQVSVVGLYPAYPNPDCYDDRATALFDVTAGFAIHRRFRFTPHRHQSQLARAVREQWTALLLGVRALKLPADVVITSSPSMFLGPVALVLARMKRAAFVWDVRDVTWKMAVENEIGGNRLLRLLAQVLNAVLWATARRCDLLVAATPGIARVVAEAGVAGERIITVENGITEQLRIALATARAGTRRQRPVVTYVGLLGQAQQVSTLIEAAQHLPGVDFVIVGDGPQRLEMGEQMQRTGCDNVRLMGYVPPDRLPELFAGSDVLFAQVVDSPTLNQTARPSKLLEYMAAGRPILYAGYGDAAALINEVGCGVCTAPGDAGEIADALRELLADQGRLEVLGRRGADYIDALPSRDERMHGLAETVLRRFSMSGATR